MGEHLAICMFIYELSYKLLFFFMTISATEIKAFCFTDTVYRIKSYWWWGAVGWEVSGVIGMAFVFRFTNSEVHILYFFKTRKTQSTESIFLICSTYNLNMYSKCDSSCESLLSMLFPIYPLLL